MQIAEPTYNGLRVPLIWSAVMHSLLAATLLVAAVRAPRGEAWGGAGGGGVVTVGLVGSLPGVPLPRPESVTPSRVVDETRGLHKAEPKAPPKVEPAAKEIPEFLAKKSPKYVTRPSKVLENPTPPPPGAIPYGEGGTPSVPYTQFSMGGSSQGGLGFTGAGGGGDFAGRFPWYVEAVRRRISGNWLHSTVDPSIRWAPRAVVSFQVFRDGSVGNIQMLRSSGNTSVDNSAVRAILNSSPLERLPNDYAGSFVIVEFWFDFRRQ